jgi:hypothetical protein
MLTGQSLVESFLLGYDFTFCIRYKNAFAGRAMAGIVVLY